MNRRLLLLIALCAIAVSLFLVVSAGAQSGGPPTADQPYGPPIRVVSDNDVNQIAKKLYCPVCPNTPLDVCETKACQDWRKQIKDQLEAGWSEDQVINFFVTQYGERVLAEPERRGISSLVRVLPVLAVLAGLVLIWQVIRSWTSSRRAESAPAPPAPAIPPETLAKIEKALEDIT